jgi:hypothetical protein
MPDIQSILDPLPVDKAVKAQVWDDFHGSASPEDFQSRFDRLNLPKEVKAQLWDMKFSQNAPRAARIPGMERLGELPPLPGIPLPEEDTVSKIANMTVFAPERGVQQAVAGVKRLGKKGERMAGANDIIEGGFAALTPAVLAALAVHPLTTGLALGTAMAMQTGAEKGAEVVGASPEAARLTGNIAALGSGTAVALGPRWVRARRLGQIGEVLGRAEPRLTTSPQARIATEALTQAARGVEGGVSETGALGAAASEPARKGLAKTAKESAMVFRDQYPPSKSAQESARVFQEQLPPVPEVPKVEPPLQPPPAGDTLPKQEPPNVAGGAGPGRPDGEGAGGVLPKLPEPRQPSGPVRRGKETYISVPETNEVQRAHYELRELDDVVPSHEGITFRPNPGYWYKNERNYGSPEYQAITIKRAQEFDPAKVVNDSPNPTSGPTIIDPNGNSLSGTNRIQILQRIYALHPDHVEAYKAKLASDLPHYGIDPAELANFKKPGLFRVLDEDFDPVKVIRDYNKDEASALLANERAMADSQRISSGTLEEMARRMEDLPEGAGIVRALEGEDGISFLNRLIDDGVLTRGEANGLIEKKHDGSVLNSVGKDRVIKLLITRMYRGTDQMERTPATIQGKLERALPGIAKMEGTEGWDLRPIIHNALDVLEEARARGAKNLDDLEQQQAMFGAEVQAQPVMLAKALRDWAPTQVQDAVAKYVKESEFKGGSVFGQVSQTDAFKAAFEQEPPKRIKKKLPKEEGPLIFGGGRGPSEKGSFSLTPLEPSNPRGEETWLDRYKNFREMRISPPEQEKLKTAVLDVEAQRGAEINRPVPWSEVLEAAKDIDPTLVKEVQWQASMGAQTQGARYAIEQRINSLNREVLELDDQIRRADELGLTEQQKLDLDRQAREKETDYREYIGQWAGISSMDGRNLAMHRMMTNSTWSVPEWLTKARRAAALPPGVDLPEAQALPIRKIIAEGQKAQEVVDAAIPPEVKATEATAKAILESAGKKVAQTQEAAAKASAIKEQTEAARQQKIEAQRALTQARKEYYSAKESYQRVVAQREELLAKNPQVKAATEQLRVSKLKLAKEVANLQRTGWWEMMSSVWRAGLLTGPKTHARNILGNFAFQGAEELARVPASMLDIVLSGISGRRETAGSSLRAITRASADAATKGVREAAEIMQHGATLDDLAKVERVAEMNFQGLGKYSKILNTYVNTVFRTMSAEDKVAKVFGARRSLEAQAKVIAMNEARQGALSRQDVLKRATWLAEHPTEPMAAQAIADAAFTTFNNRNILASALSRFQSALPAPGRFVMNLAFPFVRTPTNIAMRLFNYTPMGPAYTIPKALIQARRASGKFLTPGSQKVVSEAFGRGATGAAIIYLGYKLAEEAMATGTGQIPAGQRNVQEAAGRPTGGVRIGSHWYQFLGFAPIGNLITVGASLYRERTGKLSDEARRPARIAAIATRSVLDQPLMTGMQSIIDALENPEARATRLAEGYAGSVVPTLVSDAATLIDPRRRQVEGPVAAVANRLPFLRSTLPERTDVMGRPLEANRSAAFNPFLPRRAQELSDPLVGELVRSDVRIGDPNRRPGEPPAEYQARRNFVGKLIEMELRQTVDSTDYWAGNPDEKKELLNSAVRRARANMAAYTTQDDDYQGESVPQRVQRLKQYMEVLEGDLQPLRGGSQIPPVPGVQ